MKRNLVRVLVSALALLLCLPLMFACGKKDNGGETLPPAANTTESGNRELTDIEKRAQEKDNLPASVETDYQGKKITTYSFHENYELDAIGSEDGNAGDIVRDQVYRRNEKVQDRLGITIINKKSDTKTWADYGVELNTLTNTADENTFQIIYTMGNSATYTKESDLFHNLADYPMLSLSSPWWKLDAMTNLSFDGETLYYGVGDIAITTYNKAGAIFVNSRIYNAKYEHGMDGLYDLVIDGNWTLEELHNRAKESYQDPDNDGLDPMQANDVLGFAIGTQVRLKAMEYGFDVRRWSRDEMGGVQLDYDLERASTAVKLMNDLITNNEGVYYQSGYISTGDFTRGNILFVENQLGMLMNLGKMEDNFGVLPTPKLDKNQKEYTTEIQESSTLVTIPKFCGDPTFSSVVVEALCAESYRIVVLPYIETCMKVQYVRESRVGKIIDIILKSADKDYFGLYLRNEMGGLISKTVHLGPTELSSQYDTWKSHAEGHLLERQKLYFPELFAE